MTEAQPAAGSSRTPGQQLALEIAAKCVELGEYTTYQDVAFAAYGDFEAHRAVASAISRYGVRLGSKVIRSDRRVSDQYESKFSNGQTIGPEMQRVLLEHAGVTFDANGQADPVRQVDVLTLLIRAERHKLIDLRTLAARVCAYAEAKA